MLVNETHEYQHQLEGYWHFRSKNVQPFEFDNSTKRRHLSLLCMDFPTAWIVSPHPLVLENQIQSGTCIDCVIDQHAHQTMIHIQTTVRPTCSSLPLILVMDRMQDHVDHVSAIKLAMKKLIHFLPTTTIVAIVAPNIEEEIQTWKVMLNWTTLDTPRAKVSPLILHNVSKTGIF